MMLVIPALVVSAFVWMAMATVLSWLVRKLWMANKTEEGGLGSANRGEVEQVPSRSRLTDYRHTAKQNRRIDEVALMRNWRPIAPFRGRWDECSADVRPVGDYPVARARAAGRRGACEMVVDETGEANMIGGWNV